MKTEEMKNPETRDELLQGNTEIDLDKDGEKIAGGDDTRARVRSDLRVIAVPSGFVAPVTLRTRA